MNELLYKKIDDCIRERMQNILDKIKQKAQENGEDKASAVLTMLIIILCADISNGIEHILKEDTQNA